MRLVFLLALLGGCLPATAKPSGEEVECSSVTPCARVTGYSCEAGEKAEVALPEGALVLQVVSVEVITAGETADVTHDFIQPITGWSQTTLDQLFVDCPTFGEIVVYYYET